MCLNLWEHYSLSKEKKNLARKKKKLSEAAKERGEKENVLAAKAYFKALRIKAGLKINEETFSNIPWDDWIEDWNENGNSELNVADWLKEAGLEKYVREAMDLQQIVKYFGNINNLIGAWAANYNISNYNWPLEPWKYLVVKSNINKNMILSISHMQHNTLKRWFSYLRPITAQNLIDIDRLLKNPITTKDLTEIILDENFKNNDYSIYKYLIKYAGLPIRNFLSTALTFKIDPWDDIREYNGLSLLWSGHGQVRGHRYLEACKKVGLDDFAERLYKIFKLFARHNNEQTLQPYYEICHKLKLKPLQIKRPTIYLKKNTDTLTLNEIKNEILRNKEKFGLGYLYDDICKLQIMNKNRVTGEDILDIWAYQVGMGNDYTKICKVLNFGNREPSQEIIIEMERNKLLEMACRQSGVRWTLLSRHNFLEFKRHRLQVKG